MSWCCVTELSLSFYSLHLSSFPRRVTDKHDQDPYYLAGQNRSRQPILSTSPLRRSSFNLTSQSVHPSDFHLVLKKYRPKQIYLQPQDPYPPWPTSERSSKGLSTPFWRTTRRAWRRGILLYSPRFWPRIAFEVFDHCHSSTDIRNSSNPKSQTTTTRHIWGWILSTWKTCLRRSAELLLTQLSVRLSSGPSKPLLRLTDPRSCWDYLGLEFHPDGSRVLRVVEFVDTCESAKVLEGLGLPS